MRLGRTLHGMPLLGCVLGLTLFSPHDVTAGYVIYSNKGGRVPDGNIYVADFASEGNGRYRFLSVQVARVGSASPVSLTTYAFDCSMPRRVAIVGTYLNASKDPTKPEWVGGLAEGLGKQFKPEALKYQAIKAYDAEVIGSLQQVSPEAASRLRTMPSEAGVAAAFACEPKDTADQDDLQKIAGRLLNDSAGLSDVVNLECDLASPDGTKVSVNVGFSEATGHVRVGPSWVSDRTVSPRFIAAEAMISSANEPVRLSINRTSGQSSISMQDGTTLFSGSCERSGKRIRKF